MLRVHPCSRAGFLRAFACYITQAPRPCPASDPQVPLRLHLGLTSWPLLRTSGTDQHRFGNLYIVTGDNETEPLPIIEFLLCRIAANFFFGKVAK